MVLRNRDLFHLWAVENIFQPKLLKDVLIKLNEQSTNVLDHIHNAAKNDCLSRGKALDKVCVSIIFGRFYCRNLIILTPINDILGHQTSTNDEDIGTST